MSFSKLQKKQYKEIKNMFTSCDGKTIFLSEEDDIRLKRVLNILIEFGTICHIAADGGEMYTRLTSFETFEEAYKDDVQEEKQLSRREWKIAITSAVIGAAIGLIPTIISFF